MIEEDLRAARTPPPPPEGFKGQREWAAILGRGISSTRETLTGLVASGKFERILWPTVDVDGRRQTRPLWRRKTDSPKP